MTTPVSAPRELSTSRRIFQRDIQLYAEASGDFNPIHVDPVFAAKGQFGGTIAHGMLVLAYVSELMTKGFGQAWLSGGRLRIRFKGAARPGDTLAIKAVRADDAAVDGARTVTYEVSCRNDRDELVLEGQAIIVL